MRTTSTNVIMIGIAISDISTMLNTIYKHYMLVDIENPEWYNITIFTFKSLIFQRQLHSIFQSLHGPDSVVAAGTLPKMQFMARGVDGFG